MTVRGRSLAVAAVAVAGSLALGAALSGAAVGAAEILAEGWDAIGVMLLLWALLVPVWCALSLLGLRAACRRWLAIEPGLPRLAVVVALSAAAGLAVVWVAAYQTLPGGAAGPVFYAPAAAIAVLTVLLQRLSRRAAR